MATFRGTSSGNMGNLLNAQRFAQRFMQRTTDALRNQPKYADMVRAFDNQRLTAPRAPSTPGGTTESQFKLNDAAKNEQVALSPVSGAQELTRGVMDAGQRALSFNSRLTALAQQKAARQAAERARASQNGAGYGGSGKNTVVNANYRPGGPVGRGRQGVLDLASTYLGSPYVLGGNSYNGIDCSGLVQQVYSKFGFNFPRLAADQAAVAGMRTSVNNLRPGDLVAWADGSHIAIYAGNGMVIQALNPGQGTIKSHLSEQTNQNYYGVALRFPSEK